jgi:hypothetical protein
MRGTAKPFERRYAGNQRKAVFKARFELDLAYVEIERRARNGTLIPGEPFDIGWQVIGNLCRKEAERRRGRFDSKLADMPHRDAIEELRRAALGVAEDLMVDMRATSQKKPRASPRAFRLAPNRRPNRNSRPIRTRPVPAARTVSGPAR